MQAKSVFVAVALVAGLLAGCGGVEGSQQDSAQTPEVEAAALCSDCGWLYVRCMSRAQTAEAKEMCEYGRMDCEATWCTAAAPEVEQANACVQQCDTRLNQCLRLGTTPLGTCFYRHNECINNCPIVDAHTPVQAQ
ncbi:hypothetical protein A176_002896 [Myxococcus hansupus]|uniref:Lipoprotein n=1 Tax=Pseudomyxococcus hansupus TaxID=1297742 RepID=A0A0H4WT48_9BACT|nr:hypothetical protein [Myxococcus hansupus]AKQ65984.1 hypothetical protein A176_002896 [Myxococcus hansupus]